MKTSLRQRFLNLPEDTAEKIIRFGGRRAEKLFGLEAGEQTGLANQPNGNKDNQSAIKNGAFAGRGKKWVKFSENEIYPRRACVDAEPRVDRSPCDV